jgi:hypothetical protein
MCIIIVDWLVNYAIVQCGCWNGGKRDNPATFKQNMSLHVRELGANGSAGFEWNPALRRPTSGAGARYDSVTIVDQSFGTRTLPRHVMNTRKPANLLNRRSQGRDLEAKPVRPCRSEVLKSNLLKYRLKRNLATEASSRIPDQMLNRAVAEAEALAWTTPYPLLFLPGLVEEKVLTADRWASRQQEILKRQKSLAADSLVITE